MVTQEEFARTQHILGRAEHNGNSRHEFAYSGVLSCANCGRTMIGEQHIKPSGRRYVYYRCHRRGSDARCAEPTLPEQLYEAASIDGANWWQKMWYITLPMMRNIISITVLFSLIVTFANFDIVRILTSGGPVDQTHVFATWAFNLGIQGNDIPLGASVSLFMLPILGISAIFILRGVTKRGNEA
jgi:hypothetical protein